MTITIVEINIHDFSVSNTLRYTRDALARLKKQQRVKFKDDYFKYVYISNTWFKSTCEYKITASTKVMMAFVKNLCCNTKINIKHFVTDEEIQKLAKQVTSL
jgi:hypothetical protein